MKNSERFTNAVTKLYNAFHNGELNAFDCKHCAVGNILDNRDGWDDYFCNTFNSGEGVKSFFTNFTSRMAIETAKPSGYSPKELHKIEYIFLKKFENRNLTRKNAFDKEAQFKGLQAVVKYLCELEGIDNIMDYSKLFEFNKANEPVHELAF